MPMFGVLTYALLLVAVAALPRGSVLVLEPHERPEDSCAFGVSPGGAALALCGVAGALGVLASCPEPPAQPHAREGGGQDGGVAGAALGLMQLLVVTSL